MVLKFTINYDWVITEYSELSERKDSSIFSPEFYGSPDKNVHCWKIQLKFDSKEPNYYGAYLCCKSIPVTKRPSASVLFGITCYNKQDKEVTAGKLPEHHIFDGTSSQGFGMPKFIEISRCHISSIKKISIEMDLKPQDSDLKPFLKKFQLDAVAVDLTKLLEKDKEEFADVTIVCGDKEFKANKSVLIARSQMFEGMFRSNMKESNSNTITIKEANPKYFDLFLNYIYSGNVTFPDIDSVEEILNMAEMYDVKNLKDECLTYMNEMVSVDTAIQFLINADKFHLKKKSFFKYIKKNMKDIRKTNQWKLLKKDYDELLEEVLEYVID